MSTATKKKDIKQKSITRKTTKRVSTKRVKYVPSLADISQRAYEIFTTRGGEHGHDIEDWLQAESELNKN